MDRAQARLGELEVGLDDAMGGTGGLFVLVGEPGIGKTRFADEVAKTAKERGFTVHRGRCWEVGGAPAFWPWIQIFRSMLRDPRSKDVASAYGDVSNAFSPSFVARQRGRSKTSSMARRRGFDSSTSCGRSCAPPPNNLRFFWSSTTSTRPIRRPSRSCSSWHATSAITASSSSPRTAIATLAQPPTWPRRFGRSPKKGRSCLSGGSLSTRHASSFARARDARSRRNGPGPPRRNRGEPPVRRSGVPHDRDAPQSRLARARGADSRRDSGDDPESPRHSRREGARAARDRRCGRARISRALLAAVDGEDDSSLRAPLRAALDAGVLVEPVLGAYEFAHALFREAVYRDLDATRRAELHARVAHVLETSSAPERALGEIAQHLLAAATVVGKERALEGALRASAPRGARARVRRRCDHRGERHPGASARAPCARASLALLAEMRCRTGEHPAAQAAAEESAAIARRLADPTLLAEAALALGAELAPGTITASLVALLEEAKNTLPSAPTAQRRAGSRAARRRDATGRKTRGAHRARA